MKLDATFWGYLLVAVFSLASIGCFGVAAAHSRAPASAEILTTDNCPPPSDLL
jgi:hypothetical protein